MKRERLFSLAAAFNILGAIGGMTQPALFYRLMYGYDGPIDGVWTVMHVGFWFLIGVFGVGYALVGQDPVHNRGILVLGVIGKLGFVLSWLVEIAVWRGTAWLIPGAAGDLLFALLFLRWLRAHPVRVPI
jgi:hypothetical protein